MGSRHRDEAFGDPYELPPDRAYAETCAAIASVMLAWRLLLATGEAGYADAIERAIYNGVLSGLSPDRHASSSTSTRCSGGPTAPASRPGTASARPGTPCACCPPNLMRLLSSWQQYLATSDDTGVQLHQYATADIEADIGRRAGAAVGAHRLPVGRAGHRPDRRRRPSEPWTLSLRVPRLVPVGDAHRARRHGAGRGRPGAVRASPALASRATRWSWTSTCRSASPSPTRGSTPCAAASRSSAARWSTASSRPTCRPATELEDLRWDPAGSRSTAPRPDLGDGVVGRRRSRSPGAADRADLVAGAIPYYAWANRGAGAMRVWIPR